MKLIYTIEQLIADDAIILSKTFNDMKYDDIDLSNFSLDEIYYFIKLFNHELEYIEIEDTKISDIKNAYNILSYLGPNDEKLIKIYVGIVKHIGYAPIEIENSCISIIKQNNNQYINILNNIIQVNPKHYNIKNLIEIFPLNKVIEILNNTFITNIDNELISSNSDFIYCVENNLSKYSIKKYNDYILLIDNEEIIDIKTEQMDEVETDYGIIDIEFEYFIKKIAFIKYKNKFYKFVDDKKYNNCILIKYTDYMEIKYNLDEQQLEINDDEIIDCIESEPDLSHINNSSCDLEIKLK